MVYTSIIVMLHAYAARLFLDPPSGPSPQSQASTPSSDSWAPPRPASHAPDPHSECVTIYTIQAGDTCNSIAVSQNVTTFAVYGPHGLRDCANLRAGNRLCLPDTCETYQVQQGDTCDSIVAAAGLAIPSIMLSFWNPFIDRACSNLDWFVGEYICLKPADEFLAANIPTTTYLPKAPGTLANCTKYKNHKVYTKYDTVMLNRCHFIASTNDVTIEQLQAWNPSLGTDESDCNLAEGYSYCVRNGDTTRLKEPPAMSACFPPDPALIPLGTVPSCTCYAQYSGIDNGFLPCDDFADDFKTTVANLQAWNPWLAGSLEDCNTALFAGLHGESNRQICVRNGKVRS